ncbi:hypothetical protein [Anaerospora hongkongensis]|uniref:hypothetical protein n=1 Tax=Anaerospora hongkongensis TaxID=244830 RepID=UPI002896CE0C|nr:hypothetical protein [Anaerospora hongkongensis]
MEKTCNQDIYELVRKKRLRLWWIAYELKMQDSNFARMMRKPLTPERRGKILEAIEKLSKGDVSNG